MPVWENTIQKAEMGSGLKNFNLMEMVNAEINFERTEFGDGMLPSIILISNFSV